MKKKAVNRRLQAQLSKASAKWNSADPYPRHKQPWTSREDKLLLKLMGRTARPKSQDPTELYDIAVRVGRTPMAIAKRHQLLCLAISYGAPL
jgi:hypothetical protein